jgi:hypothetical protein
LEATIRHGFLTGALKKIDSFSVGQRRAADAARLLARRQKITRSRKYDSKCDMPYPRQLSFRQDSAQLA